MLELYVEMSRDTSGKHYGGWYSGRAFAVQPGQTIRVYKRNNKPRP